MRSLLAPGRAWRARGRPDTAPAFGGARFGGGRPYATIVLVGAGCAAWIASRAEPVVNVKLAIIGPLGGDWWRLLSSQFAYGNGVYAFSALVTVGLFGWLLERRHGPVVVLALFLGAGVIGGLLALAVYPFPVLSGANAGALALLAAWAAPEWRAGNSGPYDDADLLGAAAIAALLLALPFAIYGVSWLAGVSGGALGFLVGLGLGRLAEREP
jgi:membrane associated rhomboid family serine protease